MLEQQFQISYNMLSDIIKDIDEKQADFQLELAKNNIKWQLGHLIMANESFVFGSKEEGNLLGEKLGKSFSPGTSPESFTGVEPTFQELKGILNQQLERILNALDVQMDKSRKEPLANMTTFGETISFAIIHTNYHIGQINLMKTMLTKLDQGV
ncbi:MULTISPECIES: DinB family protein [Mammaliicoccus]|uniref:DinB family protein n=1 Tax=Mammaliicoccus TaxID=2803850 RepID=UPI000DF89F76|nr:MULTISPECIES: DinB family protein [Mammaliicoccus]RIL52272.1 DinB family protein [Mammaliicoccus fleurettii]RTX83794.1 DinB family protein [Mammaliicoccus fleurettii]SUM35972.1 DinB superfamily [Mammaliicoccus fleurettii]HCN61672.1 DinB family protein [Staphylococcus sp.]